MKRVIQGGQSRLLDLLLWTSSFLNSQLSIAYTFILLGGAIWLSSLIGYRLLNPKDFKALQKSQNEISFTLKWSLYNENDSIDINCVNKLCNKCYCASINVIIMLSFLRVFKAIFKLYAVFWFFDFILTSSILYIWKKLYKMFNYTFKYK